MRTISWSEAVDEALCFGWIDSRAKPLYEEKYMQFFSKRQPKVFETDCWVIRWVIGILCLRLRCSNDPDLRW